MICGCVAETAPQPAPVQAPPKPREPTQQERMLAAQTPADDAEREKAIAGAQASGLIGKFDVEHHTLIVGAPFYAADFEVKKAIARVVVLTGMRKLGDPLYDLALIDQKTGKRAGFYSAANWSLTME